MGLVDKWVAKNPVAASYMLYLSAVIILVLVFMLWYYNNTKEIIENLNKELGKKRRRKKKKEKEKEEIEETEEFSDVDEKDGFMILKNDG